MDSRSLRLFISLSDTLHFAKTAEACHMTPSAVSRKVQRMEQQLGLQLLVRNNRSVSLTDAGHRFREYALDALARWEELQRDLRKEGGELTGELRLYCSVTASYSILSGILPRFRQCYPGIEIKLRTGDQAESIPRVLAGEDDIAIAAHPGVLSRRLHFQAVAYSPLHFIAPLIPCAVQEQVDKQLASSGRLDWSGLPFITSEHGLARKRLDAWFKARGVKPRVYAHVSGHEAIVAMVGLGFGLGVVPELVIQHSPLINKIRRLDVRPELEPFAIGLCVQEQSLKNPLVNALWSVARELSAEKEISRSCDES
jgi:LysR family positive regulator for ilvC